MTEPVYGTTKTAEPIQVPNDRPFVTSTPNPTDPPMPSAMRAFNAVVQKDLLTQRGRRGGS